MQTVSKAMLAIAAASALTLAAPAQAAAIVGGSALLTSAYADQLQTWLGEGAITLTNLYTKQANDTSATFHAAVDGQGRTFVVMSASVQGGTAPAEIIGGYDPLPWGSSSYYHVPAVRDAFLFNLTDTLQQLQNGLAPTFQTYNNNSYGPTFGGGHDLYVANTLKFGYVSPYSYSSSMTNILGNSGFQYINVAGLEVFTISAGEPPNPAPEPGALALVAVALAGLGWIRRGAASRN